MLRDKIRGGGCEEEWNGKDLEWIGIGRAGKRVVVVERRRKGRKKGAAEEERPEKKDESRQTRSSAPFVAPFLTLFHRKHHAWAVHHSFLALCLIPLSTYAKCVHTLIKKLQQTFLMQLCLRS